MTSSHAQHERLPGPDREPDAGTEDRIVRVDEDLRLRAVERLVSGRGRPDPAHARRFVEFSAANSIRIDGMWSRVRPDGTVTATVLAVPNPGRTAMMFASTPITEADRAGLARLIDHVCGRLPDLEVDLAQALLAPHESDLRASYTAGGFTFLADLSYMERPIPRRGRAPAPEWPDGVAVEPYDESREDALVAVLDASYEETLDCPGLRGLRRTRDILAGHQATGLFDPALWTLLTIDGAPSGALLLSSAPASDTVELVYIGLARRARHRGLGRRLLHHGLHRIAGRAERALTLAVDERNEPAIALYRGEGFRRVMRRVAFIRGVRIHR